MSKVYLISDTHFSHKNIISFVNGDKPLRPFTSMEEMDEHMVCVWNETVKTDDKIIHLGDVVFAKTGFQHLSQLNGRKILLMGNHERHKLDLYREHFEEIHAYKEIGGGILSHIPVHTSQLDERWKFNIHGHLHANSIDDSRYFCASVEQIDYKPILLEEILDVFRKRGVLNDTKDQQG